MNKFLIMLATVIHLVPHPFGVSPVGASAIYAGAYADRRFAWMVPLIPLLVGNLVYGFYEPIVLIFVYAGFMLSSVAGRLLSNKQDVLRLGAASVCGALIFFLVSNYSIWLVGMYPQTSAGLLQCYANGLPYLGAATAANFGFGILLFGAHKIIDGRWVAPEPA